MTVDWRVVIGEESTTAVFEPPLEARHHNVVFVCAHGAGGHMHDRGMARASEALRGAGLGIVRFNFLYSEKRSRRPDPMPRLQRCIEAVVARTRSELGDFRLIIGGRSMGGRAASMLSAEGFACDALLLLAYPLHPAGRPEKLRDAHLPSIRVPVLCFNGTRDDLCRRDLMEAALRGVTTRWTMHWLDGADHSFHVLKSSGRNDGEVMTEIAETTRPWVDALANVEAEKR